MEARQIIDGKIKEKDIEKLRDLIKDSLSEESKSKDDIHPIRVIIVLKEKAL